MLILLLFVAAHVSYLLAKSIGHLAGYGVVIAVLGQLHLNQRFRMSVTAKICFRLVMPGAVLRDRMEDAFEWMLALLLNLYVAGLACC